MVRRWRRLESERVAFSRRRVLRAEGKCQLTITTPKFVIEPRTSRPGRGPFIKSLRASSRCNGRRGSTTPRELFLKGHKLASQSMRQSLAKPVVVARDACDLFLPFGRVDLEQVLDAVGADVQT